jgi:hypothetical protein
MVAFDVVLSNALPPIALISGIGLLILSLVNRYNHALDRIRVMVDRKDRPRSGSVHVLHRRCRVLRSGLLALATSASASSLLVFTGVVEALLHTELSAITVPLLLVAVTAIVVGCVMFMIDVILSLRALEIDLYD